MRLPGSLLLALFLGCAHSTPPQEGEAHSGELHSDSVNHRFEDAEAWAARFEDPKRDAWQRPDEVLATLKLKPDAIVADIGAATGYFPVRFARVVPKGRVYGVDIESSMVTYLANRAKTEHLDNLIAILGTPDDAKLPEPVDLVTVVDTYHHIENRPAYFAKLSTRLKPGARLVIIDFTQRSKMGPPASAKLPPEAVTRELAQAGYTLAAEHTLPEQFFLEFTHP